MDKKTLQTSILENKYNPQVWQNVLLEYFGAKTFHQKPFAVSLLSNDLAESAVELGSFYTADERLVGMYEVQLKSKAWIQGNRVGLRSLLRQVYKYDVDAALIVFVQADKWRFSYVSEIRTQEGKKETEPKRYTYLFGKGETSRTAADRFEKLKGKPIYLTDLFEAFNVEKLNKEFFKTYKEFYQKGVAEIIERKPYYKLLIDKTQEDEEKKEKPIRDFVKKMLGRIVFLHFLQKKGWMGVPVGIKNEELKINNWIDGDTKFLQNLFLHCPDKAHFLSKYLRILFFETLNTKRKNDLIPKALSWQSLNHKNHSSDNFRVPYLNGGLFDKDNSFYNDINFTADYFKNLLKFFEQYNFTIDENDPYDNEVGIDPEMLGHIFENLLEENKDKGAFYTPKEVVHYMCQESLIQYLRTHLPECTEDESPATITLQNFIRKGIISERTDKKNFVVQQAKRIEKLLDRVKICDPAIGSGAFPMGMLQEIYKAKTNLDLTLDHTEVKKDIIQNCIYGVDVENGAVEIARLRFWLALVVDETTPHPLPNLDYKIMQGNSLLESFEGVDLSKLAEDESDDTIVFAHKNQYELGAEFSKQRQSLLMFDQKSKTQLYDLISDYFNYDETASAKYKSKQFIKDEINRIVEGKLLAKFYLQKPTQEQKIKELHTAIKANPRMDADAPGVRLKKEKNLEKLNNELSSKENEFEKLNSIIEQLHDLQTRTDKPYFLWHLWFKDVFDKGGFDIVIGNPPYIQLQKMVKEADILKHANFQTFQRTGDIYTLFFEQGFKHLKPKGNLVFITGSAWLRSNYGKSLRKFFLENTNGKILIDLSDAEVFESATVLTTIHLFTKEKNEKQLKALRLTKKNQNIIKDLPANFSTLHTLVKNLDENGWVIADTNKQLIKSKVVEQGKKLKDWNIEINYGIKTGLNEAFVIDETKRKELIKQDAKSAEIIKPLLRGRDLGRYKNNFANLYLINAHNGVKSKGIEPIIIRKYPALEKHLKQFKNELEKRQDQGDHWYNLRSCAYIDDFEKPKILYPNMVKDISFSYDDEGYYTNQKCFFFIGKNLKYLLATLNSKLFRYCFEDDFPELQGNSREINKVIFEQIPVKIIADKEQKPYEALTNKILELKKEKLSTTNYENKIDALVFNLYELTEIEMLQVLNTFKDMSIKDRNQIQNEYWNIANNKFQLEA